MPSLKLKNASIITIHGKRPGQVFSVETDEDGIPLEMNWRNRLRDEASYALGHIVSAPLEVPMAPAAAPPPAPSPRREKGKSAPSMPPASELNSAPAEKE